MLRENLDAVGNLGIEVPSNLLNRIQLLEDRNATLQQHQDEMLQRLHGSAACTCSHHACSALPEKTMQVGDVAAVVREQFGCLLEQRLTEPLVRFQRSWDAMAEEQRRWQHQQQQQWQKLEEESARQEQRQNAQLLQLEEALLSQSVQREEDLSNEFRDLEREWAELEAANACVRSEALLLENAAAERCLEGIHCALFDGRRAHSLAGTAACTGRDTIGGSGCLEAREPHLPQGLPRVYEAAVTLVLEHGWAALHGGRYAGPAWTALHWAASEGRADVCNLLLRALADPGHRDETGKTPLDYALAAGHQVAAAALQVARGQSVARMGPLAHCVPTVGTDFGRADLLSTAFGVGAQRV